MTPIPETADIAGLVEELNAWGPLVASGYECPAASKAMHRAAVVLQSIPERLAEAQSLLGALQLELGHSGNLITELTTRATTAEAQAKAMREALEPFALAAADIDDDVLDSSEMWEHPASMSVTAGDFRRAALAREGK